MKMDFRSASRILSIIGISLVLLSCSISQSVEPTELSSDNELCIIENTDVRQGFLTEYRSALTVRGIPHKVISEDSVPESCEWTSTYTALWRWDLALYMTYAEIKVFKNGILDGEAIYDSTKGGANMSKFIDAEPKIHELVEQLINVDLALLSESKFV